MNKILKKALTIILCASMLLAAAGLVSAEGASEAKKPVPPQAANAVKKPFDSLKFTIKTMLNEVTDGGSRIAAVVKVENTTGKPVRIPDYAVRVRLDLGTEFALQPGANNVKLIEPWSVKELSFMTVIDTKHFVRPEKLLWVDSDWTVYPKVDKVMLALDIPSDVWSNDYSRISDTDAIKIWGESFQIPSLDTSLKFKPVSILREYSPPAKERVVRGGKTLSDIYIVTIEASNPSSNSKNVPDLKIRAKSRSEVYYAERVDKDPMVLLPNENKFMRYTIAVDEGTTLQSLIVHSAESFALAGANGQVSNTDFSVGRVEIILPTKGYQEPKEAVSYDWNQPMAFDSQSSLIPSGIQVSLAGSSMLSDKDVGFRALMLRFKIDNRSGNTMAVPAFQTELVTEDGKYYAGLKQESTIQQIMPNSGVIVAYTFMLPFDDKGKAYTLHVLDDKMAAPYKTTIGSYRVQMPVDSTGTLAFSLYPFDLKVRSYEIKFIRQVSSPLEGMGAYMDPTNVSLKIDFKINRVPNVLIDPNFAKIQMELVNSSNKPIAPVKTVSLFGPDKLTDGMQTIVFDGLSESDLSHPIMINFYELQDTPFGPAKRYMGRVFK